MRHALLLLALLPTAVELGSHITCFRDKPVTKIDLAQEKCLAVMIYGEARGEQQQGQVAVAYTAVNRAAKKTVCQVVLSPKQYSIFNNNPSLRIAAMSENLEPIQKNTIDQTSWENAVTVSQLVMRKLVVDPTKGSTHYVAYKSLTRIPKWTLSLIKTVVIQNHTFFREESRGTKTQSVYKSENTLPST